VQRKGLALAWRAVGGGAISHSQHQQQQQQRETPHAKLAVLGKVEEGGGGCTGSVPSARLSLSKSSWWIGQSWATSHCAT
jgi:hypothetical protein